MYLRNSRVIHTSICTNFWHANPLLASKGCANYTWGRVHHNYIIVWTNLVHTCSIHVLLTLLLCSTPLRTFSKVLQDTLESTSDRRPLPSWNWDRRSQGQVGECRPSPWNPSTKIKMFWWLCARNETVLNLIQSVDAVCLVGHEGDKAAGVIIKNPATLGMFQVVGVWHFC